MDRDDTIFSTVPPVASILALEIFADLARLTLIIADADGRTFTVPRRQTWNIEGTA
ncbi:hypothetical protein [Mesorhizobium sp. 1B3]|uniref:hypothetical protein n=1 Tax=Mesorhizobium sp. 1B3 TaxID=3243599 RepID=UPI003D9806AD